MCRDQQSPEQILFWCNLQQLARWTMVTLYFNTMFFTLLFRVFLIRYADRGLVAQGKPQLILFNQLFWLILGAFFTMGIFFFPLSEIIRGTFYESTQAQVCLFLPLDTDSLKGIKGRIASLVYPFLAQFYNLWYTRKVSLYLNGICPRKRMSSLGRYRRNLLTFEETSKCITYWSICSIVEGLIIIAGMSSAISPTMVFWLYHGQGKILMLTWL
jgi:hypothetical protein